VIVEEGDRQLLLPILAHETSFISSNVLFSVCQIPSSGSRKERKRTQTEIPHSHSKRKDQMVEMIVPKDHISGEGDGRGLAWGRDREMLIVGLLKRRWCLRRREEGIRVSRSAVGKIKVKQKHAKDRQPDQQSRRPSLLVGRLGACREIYPGGVFVFLHGHQHAACSQFCHDRGGEEDEEEDVLMCGCVDVLMC